LILRSPFFGDLKIVGGSRKEGSEGRGMEVEVETLSSVKKRLDIQIPKDVVAHELASAYRDLGRKIHIRGFRPGKVPLDILKGYYSSGVKEEVSAKLIKDSYPQALDQTQINPVSNPIIEKKDDLKEGENFEYSVTVEVKPDIGVCEYKGLEVQREKQKITDEDIEKRLESLREMHSYLKGIDEIRPVREGDFVTIDFQAFVNGKPLKRGKAENHQIEIGANKVLPELEKGLIGVLPQEEKEITLNFPEEYQDPSLAGKEATFKLKVKGMREKILPNLDDAFARDIGDYSSLEDLKIRLRQEIEEGEERRIDSKLKYDLLSKIIEGTKFEIPEALIDHELQRMVNDTRHRLVSSGLDISGMNLANLQANMRGQAERRVREMLILEKIAQQESIEINDEDVENGLKEVATRLGQDLDTMREFYNKNNLMDSFRKRTLEEKTLNFLSENARVTEVSA